MGAKLLRWAQKRIEKALEKHRRKKKGVIIFLVDRLRQELVAAGYDPTGSPGAQTYLLIFQHDNQYAISNNNGWTVRGTLNDEKHTKSEAGRRS